MILQGAQKLLEERMLQGPDRTLRGHLRSRHRTRLQGAVLGSVHTGTFFR